MKKRWIFFAAGLLLLGCNNEDDQPDAYGNFESEPVMVSAQSQGELKVFDVEEGSALKSGEIVGLTDTMQLHLKKAQLGASVDAVKSRIVSAGAQVTVQKVQMENLQRELNRVQKLFSDGAATEKQLDDIEGSVRLLEAQIQASTRQKNAIASELQSISAQSDQVDDQISKALVTNPVTGVVLQKYKMEGEIVAPGQILYKIADLDRLILRAYISGNQLTEVKIGQEVNVNFDLQDGIGTLPGKVTWIASEAEFTPKIIQTREERVNLVYAMKVEVKNDGRLKIGMPGEVKF